DPEPEDLDANQLKQVVAAGQAYDGKKLSAKKRLRDPELGDGSFRGSLVVRRLEGNKPGTRYDIFTYMGDSGCVLGLDASRITRPSWGRPERGRRSLAGVA